MNVKRFKKKERRISITDNSHQGFMTNWYSVFIKLFNVAFCLHFCLDIFSSAFQTCLTYRARALTLIYCCSFRGKCTQRGFDLMCH